MKRSICGTREIVAKLSEGVDNIRLSCQVTGVWPQSEGGKSVCLEIGSSRIMYDHVIIATQANHAVKLLPRASNELKQALESIPYELTTVSLHRDTKLMPSNKSHWSPMNIFVSESGDGVMCTAWQNQIQPSLSSQDPVFQTWNPLVAPEPELHIVRSCLCFKIFNFIFFLIIFSASNLI